MADDHAVCEITRARQAGPGPAHHDRGREREGRMFRAFLLTAAFMIVEALGGWISGSLALLADAGHMLTDAMALLAAGLAFRMARRAPDSSRSYGYRRVEILVAWGNGLMILVLAAWIVIEAIARIFEPYVILSGTMLAVAVAGLGFNIVVLKILHGGHDHGDLNTKGAVLHVMGDVLGSVAAIGAAVAIMFGAPVLIDPILSIAVAGLMSFSAVRLIMGASHILLEGTPPGLDADEVAKRLTALIPDVLGVHHVHAWSLSSGHPLMTLHVTAKPGADGDALLAAVKAELTKTYGVAHTVVQVETGNCPDEVNACGRVP